MTTPVASTPVGIAAILAAQAAKASTPSATKSVSSLGKDDFLRMLVAQLQNQDPMNPMQGTEFATQLAQFSNVEQLINIGTKLDAQAAGTAQGQLTAQTSLAASLIGRDVLIEGNDVTVGSGTTGPAVDLSLNKAAAVLTVNVFDSKGEQVMSESFSAVPTGQQQLKLDTGDLPPGNYTYKVDAKAADGSVVTVTPYETAHVDGITFKDGAIMLRVGNRIIPLLNIIEIKAVSQTPTVPSTPLKESFTL